MPGPKDIASICNCGPSVGVYWQNMFLQSALCLAASATAGSNLPEAENPMGIHRGRACDKAYGKDAFFVHKQ